MAITTETMLIIAVNVVILIQTYVIRGIKEPISKLTTSVSKLSDIVEKFN